MAQTPLNSAKKGGDFLIDEMSSAFNLKSMPVTAPATANVPQVAGYPVILDDADNPTTCTLADNTTAGTTANAFLIHGPAMKDMAAGVSAEKYSVLWAGPAVINANAFPAKDYTGTDFTAGRVVTVAGNVSGDINVQYEPAESTAQSANSGRNP